MQDLLERIDTMGLPYLRISLTPDCNAACSFCHNDGQKTGKRGLASLVDSAIPLKELQFLSKRMRQAFDRVKFTGGEPTLVRQLPEIVSLFKSDGYRTSMTSNGFRLDEALQKELREQGLDSVNISLPSLDEKQYRQMFGVAPSLDTVLTNLTTLPEIFAQQTKINYMALSGVTAPDFKTPSYEADQFLPLLRLSADLQGTPISIMQPVSAKRDQYAEQLVQYAADKMGIKQEESKKGKAGRRLIHFKNGGVCELDDFRNPAYRKQAFDNKYCQRCPVQEECTEGPYALRVGTDLSNQRTFLKPCLIRADNEQYLETVMEP